MMISQPALLCLEATLRRMFGQPANESAPAIVAPLERASLQSSASDRPSAPAATADREGPEAEREDRGMVAGPSIPSPEHSPLTPSERRARAAALRALALCRGRRFDTARAAFVEAARLDPALDLTRTPDFWKLERGAHEAAIAAYLDVGRDGDAAVLRARVHSTYRPKPLRKRPSAVTMP